MSEDNRSQHPELDTSLEDQTPNIGRFLEELELSKDGLESNGSKLAALGLRALLSGEGVILTTRVQEFFTAISGGNEEINKALISEYAGIFHAILSQQKDRLNKR